jgi:isoleucyl-tRNA synthetase
MEEQLLHFWKEGDIVGKSIEGRRNGPRFTLYEGPPTANGSPGIHHVLARVFKDVIPRYKTMKGFYAPRQAGWDTHGLPVELEVEKELGLSSKTQIEEYGIAQFNQRCRESVMSYVKEWEALTERIAFWLDMEHPYRTFDNSYIESCWWAVKQLWDKGLIYHGYKVTPHCPRCSTSLSSHEVALGYKDDTEDPSVYIKFRVIPLASRVSQEVRSLLGTSPIYLLAWTTTPWTLPGNTALAVAEEVEYAVVEVEGEGGIKEKLVIAEPLAEASIDGNFQLVGLVKGADLIGLRYEPLYDARKEGMGQRRTYLSVWRQPASTDLTYPVVAGTFVSTEEGTGIVHIAPAFGEVDFQLGEAFALDLIVSVDFQGRVHGPFPGDGLFVKEADPVIAADLKQRGLLYRSGKIRHTYPFCWRCDSPLLYYAKRSWYIATTSRKERLVAANAEINWYPEYIKYGRFGDWLENNVDWAISRERYWGTPLPIWRCEDCEGEVQCVGSLDELKNKVGLGGWIDSLDLHRPYIDEVTFSCPRCEGKMSRVPEVMDCWFDSGAMPFAQWHFPFENHTALKDGRFPADFICEAVDQTRGWFYTLHALSTLLFDRPCFRNVICLGHILDDKGDKMSKARGNVVEPWSVINEYGADALRWYLYVSSPPGNVRRFSVARVSEVVRKFLLTLWNTYSFFVTYANIDSFEPKSVKEPLTYSELDKWVISELNSLIRGMSERLETYDPGGAARLLEDFVADLSNWYVRRSRRRFWKSENDADKMSAYTTLYRCLVTLSKLLAPFTPFIAEELYQNLVRSADTMAPESVHQADYPVVNPDEIDDELMSSTRLMMKLSGLGRAARSTASIKVRQPLGKVQVRVKSAAEKRSLELLAGQLLEELNVKTMENMEEGVEVGKDYAVAEEGGYAVAVLTELSPELKAEGMARELVHRLQTMRRAAGFDIADYIITYYRAEVPLKAVIGDFADYIKQETLSLQLIEGESGSGAYGETHKVDGYPVKLEVKKT